MIAFFLVLCSGYFRLVSPANYAMQINACQYNVYNVVVSVHQKEQHATRITIFLLYSRLLLRSDGFNAVSPIDRASKIGRFQTHTTSSTSHTFLNGNMGLECSRARINARLVDYNSMYSMFQLQLQIINPNYKYSPSIIIKTFIFQI